MTGRSSSGGRQMVLALQLMVALVVMAARVEAQGILTLGACSVYQSAANFDAAYIAKLTSATDGYALLLTSDRPRTSNCQRLTLYGNGTFLFSYNDDYNRLQNHTSTYTINEFSFTPGYIKLRMPIAVFGATLTGDLQLNVLLAEEDYMVVASCWEPVPFLRSEFVHAFVPSAKLDTVSPSELQTSLIAMGVPNSPQMREVYQGCFASTRFFLDTQEKTDLYNFFVKIGLAPPLPIRRLHEVRAGVPSQFYSAAPNFMMSQPGYHFAPSAVAPVQSFVYGPSTSASETVSTAGQGQSFVYNAAQPPSSHLSPAVVRFVPLPSGFVPVSSDVNYNSQSFSYSSPDTYHNSQAVTHGQIGPVQSSPGTSYNSPLASYSSFSPTNQPTFSNHHPVVVNYASPSFG